MTRPIRSQSTVESATTRWRLYGDWCAATDRVVVETTQADFVAFARDVPCGPSTLHRRMRTVAERLGWYETRPLLEPAQAWRSGEGWLPFLDALSHCPTDDFPGGLFGRRDAWMLVLVGPIEEGGLGLTRAQAVSVTPEEVTLTSGGNVLVRGHLIGQDPNGNLVAGPGSERDDPAACPRCAVARWLESLNEQAGWGWASVRQFHARASDHGRHVCTDLASMPRTWAEGSLVSMCPAYAIEGGLRDPSRPAMSVRTLSLILARRCSADLSVPQQDPGQEQERWQRNLEHLAYDELDDALERVMAEADVKNRRIRELLDDTAVRLARLGEGH